MLLLVIIILFTLLIKYLENLICKQIIFFHTLGWILLSLLSLDIVTVAYIPLRGRSYMEVPSDVRAKKAIINVQNTDDKCFVWSILAQLHPAPYNRERVTWYTPYEHELNMQGLYSYIL